MIGKGKNKTAYANVGRALESNISSHARTKKLSIGSAILGIVLGLTTIYLLEVKWEILLWILLVVTIGFAIAKTNEAQFFSRGFWYSVLTGVCITLTHITFAGDYLVAHPEEKELMESIDLTDSYRLTLLIIAPMSWIVLGLLSGLSSIVWMKMLKRDIDT